MSYTHLHLQTIPSDIKQCFQKQDEQCKKMYYVLGFILFVFLLWLFILSVLKSRTGKEGERGPPGPAGPPGDTGLTGTSGKNASSKEKIIYITSNKDYSSSTKVKARAGFIMGNGVKANKTITLPHWSVIGNGASFHIYNQSPRYNFIIKAAKINGKDPAQMSFSSGGTKITLLPREFVTIIIMAQQYIVFKNMTKKPPTIHWVNSMNNCGGIPSDNIIEFKNSEGFNVGPSLATVGCDDYSSDQDVIKILSEVKNANTTGENPKNVSAGGIFVVNNPDNVQLPGTISENILIGNSSSNTKTITLPAQAVKASPKPVNPQNPEWNNKFEATLTSNGTKLKVKRLDANSGWGQELILKVHFRAETP